jgi:hypothetical protein
MPRIDQEKVLVVLHNHYFDHHVAMHLSRERVDVYDPDRQPPGIVSVPPLLDPRHKCDDCTKMIEAGKPGSGRELLAMHHDMIRVLRYLLPHEESIRFGVEWERHHEPGKPSRSKWVRDCNGPDCYAPAALWNLDDPKELPTEIRALFSFADKNYLRDVFTGVQERVEVDAAHEKGDDPYRDNGPVDELGKFIERGVKSGAPHGRGFHNTIHEFLASREGRSATGAEMNKLRNALFNDYFWSLHLWMDGQYGRLLENLGSPFETAPLAPGDPTAAHARMHSMAMA